MLSYLKGHVVQTQKTNQNRVQLVLEVNAIGYDVQITSRHWQHLPAIGELAQVFTHLSVREDQITFFGFMTAAERDLFRQLISVSGIGPQLAMALLDTLSLQELVQAIVNSNTRLLAKTPGVGTKTAERIALELKSKLVEWRQQTGLPAQPTAGPTPSIREDVEMTLLALGYTDSEITKALNTVGQSSTLSKSGDAEDWIRQAIAWLSH
ncbi:MAG: Holliday junction branch migration protein RuvA [Synechococcales bacterium]|nr:Holliday junction branch migration protein RuvA [Synechococcales bacterium]